MTSRIISVKRDTTVKKATGWTIQLLSNSIMLELIRVLFLATFVKQENTAVVRLFISKTALMASTLM